MNEAWIAIGLCIVLILGAAMPLVRNRGTGKATPLPKPETLRDWRQEEREP